MTKPLSIGICGCGIGGLTAGILLARQGHDITLFDQFSSPAPVGSGLVIQPVGKAVLNTIGILENLQAKAAPLRRLTGHEVRRNRRVLNASYGRRLGLGLHRATLFDALYKEILAAGCNIRQDSDVIDTGLTTAGRTILLRGKTDRPEFDLVIDATGAGSPLSPMHRRKLQFGALWGTVDWPENTTLPRNQLTQVYKGATHMIGALPVGSLPGSAGAKAAIFWSLPQGDYARWQKTPLAVWKADVIALWPEFAPFLTQITDHSQMTMARYSHGRLSKPYGQRIAHIGDAAHCTSPQLGQGANMALLDAMALSEALRHLPLQAALTAYAASRAHHVRLYQMLSWAFTPMYQSDNRLMPFLRDWLLAPATYIPPVPWILSRLIGGDLVPPISGLALEIPREIGQ